ncbi:MAG: hypothetical protein R3353_01080 [Salegentibacter mishustinae]|nr:hypothetical protein [Salegentibacter mishustinae]
MKSFYLPISPANLAHYFRTGLIAPASFLSNRNEDLQSKIGNFLLFCSEKYTNETGCALELVLSKEEFNNITAVEDNFFIADLILPISRVKNVFFRETEQGDKTVWNIESGAAFIPNELVKIDKDSKIAFAGKLSRRRLDAREPSEKKEQKILLFDRLMGGLALMQVGGEDWQNYSENYIATLSLLNKKIKEEWKEGGQIGDFNKYDWLIFQKEGHKQFSKYVFSKVNDEVLERYAQNEGIRFEKKLGLIQLDKIKKQSYTYLAAILATFDVDGRKKIDDFFSFLFHSDFEPDRKEGIALMFGLNKGYAAFRNKYKTEDIDLEVKFGLDSQLDYYTIESIYQYVFNGKTDNYDYDYLDSWCPKNSLENLVEYEAYKILDEQIVYKKKVVVGSSEYFQGLYQNFSPEIYREVFKVVNEWFPSFMQTDNIQGGQQYLDSKVHEKVQDIFKSIFNQIKSDLEIKETVNEKSLGNKTEKSEKSESSNQNKLLNEYQLENSDESVDSMNNSSNRKNSVEEEPLSKYSDGSIIFPGLEEDNIDEKLEKRVVQLTKEGITKLKIKAKKLGIPRYSTYNNNNKDQLVKLIATEELRNG